MNLPRRTAASLLALSLSSFALTACGHTDSKSEAQSTPSTAATQETTPTPTPTPEPETLDTHTIGESITLPSATFTVKTIEQRDMIPSSSPDWEPNFTPEAGQRLWYFDIEWTNTTDEVVSKECHGPDMFDLTAYDINGAEMEMVDQPGFIEGQNCSTGLMKGETGRWQTAFRSLDADFGWAIFRDYAGEEAIVVLDPSLQLTRQ
ncbi:hypothetical protein [Actinomyces urogenitalis]|uniref:hypothetical protein n=1 Tax=Actinomyces urogenitalis TaxID=103621 RepID=UPI0029021C87|nr:hypothetical protein [Actinomyces urogenitalis]MDU6852829.1 hypothetical protein [Cutibacterium avidum]MDU0865399.1 hypothetical protein [Actinomyces urogenitalis]MDU0875857.1 hypothetical protein [Actinomyces urogenitalis]MDU1640926.1 hypothetical protein [Actinomyces urogenitalis]MDU7429296.1 hypothetical protein [Actinomyces urogenitalis]